SEYAQFLKATLTMGGLIDKCSAMMDKYDAQAKASHEADECGTWYAALPRSPAGRLVQHDGRRPRVPAAMRQDIAARRRAGPRRLEQRGTDPTMPPRGSARASRGRRHARRRNGRCFRGTR